MSEINHPTNSKRTPWNGPPGPRMPTTGSSNQRTSSAGIWPPAGLLLPQPQTQYATISPGLSLESTHGARLGEASIGGHVFSRPAHAPLTSSRGMNTGQSILNPGPASQPAHGDWATSTGREDVGNNPSPPSSRKPKVRQPRTRQPGEAQWQQNKPHIEKLYREDGLPLPEVVRLMESDHKFYASERMYKNKFKIWRWSKNLPQEKVSWMAGKVQQRLPTKTVFSWNHQEWTEEQIAQKNGKALQKQPRDGEEVLYPPTPNDIQYRTPSSFAPSPHQPLTATSQSHHSRTEGNEIDGQPRIFYLDTKPLLKEASLAASAKRTESVSTDFRDAVSGFSYLLSPTHDETLRAAYMYASFYANCAEMEKADAVLNWMSKKHVEKWGSEHEKTYLHYARMIELFRSWGRQERAELLVYRILDGVRDDDDNPFSDFSRTPSGSQQQRSITDIDLEQSFPETDDPELLSDQLDKIDLAIRTSIKGLDNVLETIIGYCEDKPNGSSMSLQACRAKCALAKLHSAAGRVEKTNQVLSSARRSLAPLLVVGEEPISRSTIEMARRLSLLFFDAKDESSCNAVLDQVIAALESRRYTSHWERGLDDVFLLDFILTTAFQFHEIASWDECRHWVERGLGLAMMLHGRKSPEARRFQKILNKNDFDMRTSTSVHDLMSFSGGFFNIRPV
ncbi:rhomboid family [Fusarium albosuccineum]|uniref:Rhomboid family n=1 Tax=Fusarium albosuccineum TaxID=1237068 RepID=A0A8H4L1A8_9HYPO|nr:rhomboid family [Fusarium albosuccineum]